MKKTGRNDQCPCGSGKKYKQCCMQFEGAAPSSDLLHRQDKSNEAVADYRDRRLLEPDAADLHYNRGCALRDQGNLSEAIACYRRAISIRPDHLMALNNLGNALGAQGDLDGAVTSYQKALAYKPDSLEAHYNLGVALQSHGKLDEAIDCYQKALSLNPNSVAAHYNLGNAFSTQGKLHEAIASYRRALALRPDFADARNNLGNVLQAQGEPEDAIDCYRKALEFKPDDAGAHNNLGNVLSEVGLIDTAVASYRRALELEETAEFKANFALCIRSMVSVEVDAGLRRLMTRALAEAWARPSDLAKAAIRLICADHAVQGCIERASQAWPSMLGAKELFGPTGLATLANDFLLQQLLEGAQVCDLALERLLTMVRHVLLDAATEAVAHDGWRTGSSFYCAIARQCFINEFVFFFTDHESSRAEHLRERLVAALRSGDPVSPLWIVAVASYSSLSSLPADILLHRSWPDPVMALLRQHVAEPLEELRCRDSIRKLTPIDDAVSSLVRQQYEENPYPRWMRLPAASEASSLNSYLRRQLPFASFHPLGKDTDIDILIAGCGTGQESIETAQQFLAARVLAVDLSLSSLCYAKRKTDEANVANIEYAQGDILQLGSIGRTFDMITSVGVLHHLAHPTAGLETLLSLLRPGGLMKLGLYSQSARRDVVAAREFIAERGYASDAMSIRRSRQDLIENFAQSGRLTEMRDFYVTSECRDLLFHVREHRFMLPQIKKLLGDFGLRFIGFLLEPHVLHKYRARFRDDKSATNLDHWNDFEGEFPDTFAGMYRFWVQRTAA
jgi:tetratricopeptide (TPR) repeat protein/2-polyprenyl-3-methyl-5-hydroxy-6-metoxy-1,4-benzoquinol methylase